MNDQQTIDRYILGQLSDEDRRAFEKEMENDSDLRLLVETEQLMADGIMAANLRAQMSGFSKKEMTAPPKAKIISLQNMRWIAAAASVAILAVFFWQTRNTTSLPGFDDVYNIDPGLPVVMGEVGDKAFGEAMVSYKEGEYEKALPTFESLCVADNSNACFYSAQIYIAQENWSKAKDQLSILSSSNISEDLNYKAEWHLAYVLFQLNDEEYLNVLNKIQSNPNHPYGGQAKDLLGQ